MLKSLPNPHLQNFPHSEPVPKVYEPQGHIYRSNSANLGMFCLPSSPHHYDNVIDGCNWRELHFWSQVHRVGYTPTWQRVQSFWDCPVWEAQACRCCFSSLADNEAESLAWTREWPSSLLVLPQQLLSLNQDSLRGSTIVQILRDQVLKYMSLYEEFTFKL